jgi:hypothetical protein
MMPLPIQFLLFILVGWASRQQQDIIGYLKHEIGLSVSSWGTAASVHGCESSPARAQGKAPRKRRLCELSPIVTPDTESWHNTGFQVVADGLHPESRDEGA